MAQHSSAAEDFAMRRAAVNFLGWIALFASFLSSSMGSETKKGVRIIFAVKLFITLMIVASR